MRLPGFASEDPAHLVRLLARRDGTPVTWLSNQLLSAAQANLVASMIQAFAWPCASVIIVAMLRAEIRLALGRVVHLKYHDFEAQFRRDLQRTEDLAKAGSGPSGR